MMFMSSQQGSLAPRTLSVLLILSLISSCIELEIAAPVFPEMASVFHASTHSIGTTVTINLIAFAVASLVYGPLADRYGRRPVMIAGNVLLLIGTTACVLAPSLLLLLIARAVQGAGAATSAVVVSAIIADVYSPKDAGKLYGIMNFIFTSLMAGSPVVGVGAHYLLGWQGPYVVVALTVAIATLALVWKLPETKSCAQESVQSLDVTHYLALLKCPRFLRLASIPNFLYAFCVTFTTSASFLLIDNLNVSPRSYSLLQGSLLGVYAVTSLLTGRLGFSLATSIKWGVSFVTGGSLFLVVASTPLSITTAAALVYIGSALLYPVIFAESMTVFPHLRGYASSFIMASRYATCAVSTMVSTFVFRGSVESFTLPLVGIGIVVLLLTGYTAYEVSRRRDI
jgi:MFS transporter, DHA1 family, multidrug resistance protein